MLRIRFTMADLARVTVSMAPLVEIAASIDALHAVPRSEFVERWRRFALPRVPRSAQSLIRLCGALGLTPPELIGDACHMPTEGPLWTVVREYYDACLAHVWDRVQANKAQAVTSFTDDLANHGIAAAFDNLDPRIRWRGEELEVDDGQPDRTADLGGRGLLVVPSVFWQEPYKASRDYGKPVLVVPVGAAPYVPVEGGDPLNALLGRTRADVLRGAVTGSGTGDIARRLGISAASVSEHATALRRAGLITTRRLGREVRHSPTPLGRTLLAPGGVGPADSATAEILSADPVLGA